MSPSSKSRWCDWEASYGRVASVGIAAAAVVDPVTGAVRVGENIGWRDVPLRSLLEARWQRPVQVDADAFCGALAESRLGAGADLEHFLYVVIGTGIGHALVLDRQVWHGLHATANVFGHIKVTPDPVPCYCGGTGCLCQYASGQGLARVATMYGQSPKTTGREVLTAYAASEAWARAVVEEMLSRLAFAVSAAYNLVDIECTVFGGGVITSAFPDLEALRQRIEPLVYPQIRPIDLRRAVLGSHAVLTGAALLAFDRRTENIYMNIVPWIQQAHREGWALGQFNISNLEVLQAIVDAANALQSPVIVGVSMGSLRHIGLPYLAGLIQGARQAAQVPLFFHLDHGADFAAVSACIEIGFDSVMLDASRNPYAENVRLVREVADYAHARDVGVEAQVGETWDEETGDTVESRTDPAQVSDFVAATGIDYLAISFGNTPGRLDGRADVDLDLVKSCAAASSVPIVLHGGTSIPDQAVREAIRAGAAKVNIDTAIRQAVTAVLQEQYGGDVVPSDPRRAFARTRAATQEAVMDKMNIFGSAHQAP